MKKLAKILFALSILFWASAVFAHVTVTPSQVNVAERVNFSVNVPVEKDTPTVSVRLVVPEGLESVMPNAKAGWKVSLKKDGEKIKEIVWTGGSIPVGLRDEFIFRAKAPASQTKLQWKAYQTYRDGSVVAWDLEPDAMVSEGSNAGPYSETEVINDLLSEEKGQEAPQASKENIALGLSVLAVAAAGFSLIRRR